ncbi:hypothetical protein [Skermania sp. ID1734]|nr:hypothetical protein [Skermania sp. ID1734]
MELLAIQRVVKVDGKPVDLLEEPVAFLSQFIDALDEVSNEPVNGC